MFLIGLSAYLTGRKGVPYPFIALIYMVTTLACYAIMVTYPNLGGVYAATTIAASASLAWFSTMWPWRLQTTSKATGSAFAIAFSNSLGQIGTIVGPQIFQSKYAPQIYSLIRGGNGDEWVVHSSDYVDLVAHETHRAADLASEEDAN